MIEYLCESVAKAAAISSGPHLGKAKLDERDVLYSLRKVVMIDPVTPLGFLTVINDSDFIATLFLIAAHEWRCYCSSARHSQTSFIIPPPGRGQVRSSQGALDNATGLSFSMKGPTELVNMIT